MIVTNKTLYAGTIDTVKYSTLLKYSAAWTRFNNDGQKINVHELLFVGKIMHKYN